MKQGTLEDRTWSETEVTEPAVKNHIKVKINFKDVSVTINIIPNNEYSLGYECAGVIQRLGPAVKKFHIGDRVYMIKQSSHANSIRVHIDRCHVISLRFVSLGRFAKRPGKLVSILNRV